jgi:hypothetical protein
MDLVIVLVPFAAFISFLSVGMGISTAFLELHAGEPSQILAQFGRPFLYISFCFFALHGGRQDERYRVTLGNHKPLSVSNFISAPERERPEAFASMTAYVGRFTFAGAKVIHHVEAASMPNDVGLHL